MRRSPFVLVALLLSSFAINIDTTIVNVALPTFVREMHATNSQLQWIVDSYNLVFASLLLAAGSFSDRLGRKGMLLAGLSLFGLASAAGGFTGSPGQLIIARCFMGLGAAMVFPSTLSIISNVYTARAARARAIGLWGAVAGLAIALGPIIGGALLAHFRWSSIFFAMTPIAATAAMLVAWRVPTSRDPERPTLDRLGLVLSVTAMALLVFTIIDAPNYGWTSARSFAGFAAAAVLLSGFVAWEHHVKEPMLDVNLFLNPRFTAACGAVTIAFFTLFGFIFLVTQFFQFFKGYNPLSTGVHMLPVAVSVAAGSVIGTKLAIRIGTKQVVTCGLVMVAVFYAWAANDVQFTAYAVIAAQMIVFGVGMGFTSAPATEAILGVVPIHKAGVGSAVNDTTRLLGGTLGVAIIGSIYASLYSHRLARGIPIALPHHLVDLARRSVGGALAVAQGLDHDGWTELGAPLRHAATEAFHQGLSIGCLVAGGCAFGGAVMVALLLPSHPERSDAALPATSDLRSDTALPATADLRSLPTPATD